MLLSLLALSATGCRSAAPAESADDCALGASAISWAPLCPGGEDLAQWVDPFLGTGGSGNTIPGPMVPHGLVKLSPDSLVSAGDIDAYSYEAESIEGFSHTHLEGPGGSFNGYSQILLQPTTGALQTDPAAYASTFDHADEVAELGYYAVTLADYGVRVELAATAHAGIQRYTFPAEATPRVLLDVGHSRGISLDGEIRFVDDSTLEGWGVYSTHPTLGALVDSLGDVEGTTGEVTVYYSVQLSRPAVGRGGWSGQGGDAVIEEGASSVSGPWIGAWVELEPGGEPVEARVGISLVSVDQARAHREEEVDGRSLEAVRDAARAEWGCLLSRVQVEGGAPEQRGQLYTALYHSFMQPTDFTESSGEFVSGAAGEPEVSRVCEGRRYFADDWCLWDTYRTVQPLATLVEPETVDDRVASMLHLYQQGGWLPKCTWMSTGYSRVMTGNPAVPVIADAYVKGFRDYDPALAWEAVERSGTADTEALLIDPVCGYLNLGTPPEYMDLGYVSHECDTDQSASMTMEYAFDDWATAQLAQAMDRPDDAAAFLARSESWRNHWDPQVGFVRGRTRDGGWVTPFDPSDGTDFVESDAWIFSFFVPQDVEGLVAIHGGAQAFIDKLDAFFDEGHFAPDNEPSFHIPLLYNHAGEAWRTQERVDALLRGSFSEGPDGLPGNDDAGATSAWYALLAMGLYPLAPGDGRYELTTPIFDRVELLSEGPAGDPVSFVIEAPRSSPAALYIQSASLNGAALDRSWITHQEIATGGTLSLSLGVDPGVWP